MTPNTPPTASTVSQQIKELKETIERNQKIAKAIEDEPNNVVMKTYIQGDPNDLYNITASLFNSLKPKRQGEAAKRFALTLMVEELKSK